MSAALAALAKKFGDAIQSTETAHGEAVAVLEASKLVEVAAWLRDDLGFAMPLFVTAIDRLGLPANDSSQDDDDVRFEVVYQIRSLTSRETVRLKVRCKGENPSVPSLSGLWRGFNWLERECYDMYGVQFDGHPDLRRIYMYEEFVGYPLRKDYPKEKRQPLVRREWTDEVTEFKNG